MRGPPNRRALPVSLRWPEEDLPPSLTPGHPWRHNIAYDAQLDQDSFQTFLALPEAGWRSYWIAPGGCKQRQVGLTRLIVLMKA